MFKLTNENRMMLSTLFTEKNYDVILELLSEVLTRQADGSYPVDPNSCEYVQPYLFAIALVPAHFNQAIYLLEKIYSRPMGEHVPLLQDDEAKIFYAQYNFKLKKHTFLDLFDTDSANNRKFINSLFFSSNSNGIFLAFEIIENISPIKDENYKNFIVDLLNKVPEHHKTTANILIDLNKIQIRKGKKKVDFSSQSNVNVIPNRDDLAIAYEADKLEGNIATNERSSSIVISTNEQGQQPAVEITLSYDNDDSSIYTGIVGFTRLNNRLNPVRSIDPDDLDDEDGLLQQAIELSLREASTDSNNNNMSSTRRTFIERGTSAELKDEPKNESDDKLHKSMKK